MAYQNRGYAKLCVGDQRGAIADYSTLIELEPKNPSAYLMRGVAKQARGEKCQEDFDVFLKLDPQGQSKMERAVAEIREKSEAPKVR